jgi:hypothetical protein
MYSIKNGRRYLMRRRRTLYSWSHSIPLVVMHLVRYLNIALEQDSEVFFTWRDVIRIMSWLAVIRSHYVTYGRQ